MRDLIGGVALLIAVSGVATAQGPGCATANPSTPRTIAYFKELVTATSDTAISNTRIAYFLPAVADSTVADTTVVEVLSPAICNRAAGPFKLFAAGDSSSLVPVTVIRVGNSRFVVFDRGETQYGSYRVTVIMDTLYTPLAGFGS